MSLFHLAKSFIQFLIVLFSMLMNLILIILVIHQSPKKIGNYKYLMCYFCVMSMIYAGIDYIVQPVGIADVPAIINIQNFSIFTVMDPVSP